MRTIKDMSNQSLDEAIAFEISACRDQGITTSPYLDNLILERAERIKTRQEPRDPYTGPTVTVDFTSAGMKFISDKLSFLMDDGWTGGLFKEVERKTASVRCEISLGVARDILYESRAFGRDLLKDKKVRDLDEKTRRVSAIVQGIVKTLNSALDEY